MPRPPSNQPTEVELAILRILWDGPAPVREIHQRLAADRDTNYSTTVKMLSVMLDKGLVKRDESKRPHTYRAASSKSKTQRKMLSDLMHRAFDGSATSLVAQALASKPATAEELQQIRQLLDELEGDAS